MRTHHPLEELPTTEALEQELHRVQYHRRYVSLLKSTIYTLITVAAVAVLVATLWLPALRIYGTSMTPTLQGGEIVLTVKHAQVKPGDIIAFYYNNKILVKRMIAGPGDWVDLDERGAVYVNDQRLEEPYLDEPAYGSVNIELPYQAPEGYFLNPEPYSFSVIHSNTQEHPLCLPEEFRGDQLRNGSLVYYHDEKDTLDLKIEKIWQDVSGQPLEGPRVEEVTVHLYQKLPGGEKKLYGTYSLTASGGWKLDLPDLPRAERLADGTKGKEYLYTVEEVSVPGFQVSYDHTESADGLISITNRKAIGYALPSTGGTGVWPFALAGLGLMSAAGVMLWRREKFCG